MYFVLRFDDQVNTDTQAAIVNSALLKEIITHFYYMQPDNTLDLAKFDADTTNTNMTYAFDTRYPVSHVAITGGQLPEDILYVYLGAGADLLTAKETIEGVCSMLPVPDEAPELQRYAWERIQLDMGEIAANTQLNPSRVVAGAIGEVKLVIARWDNASAAFENEMLVNMAQAEVDTEAQPVCDGCSDCQCSKEPIHAPDTPVEPTV